MTDRIYPQFATHNAHTCAAVLAMATDRKRFEFQRLHGMGEALHRIVMSQSGTRCRIYAPVGAHRDLLAYLVRRLLENGANSSFVNQIADERIAPEVIARDPIEAVAAQGFTPNPAIRPPAALFQPARGNARGWNLDDPLDAGTILAQREAFRQHRWQAGPMLADATGLADAASLADAAGIAGETGVAEVRGVPERSASEETDPSGTSRRLNAVEVRNPADAADTVGSVTAATPAQVEAAVAAAASGFQEWAKRPVAQRATILRRAADLYEQQAPELFALCAARQARRSRMRWQNCVNRLIS
jgi:RHH-type proline utilization regulon transcriptional repressor/proline dehydrogenase/delta 1-pyrroline-5-carboxylate dehydrogenase